MLLSQFFRHVYLQRRYLGTGTAITYWAAINRFQDWNKKPILLSRLNADLVRSFLRDYRTKNSAASANGKRQTILTLWKWAHIWGYCPTPPAADHEIPRLPVPKRTPRAWTVEEFGRILAASCVAREINHGGIVWDSRHWRALWLVIYDTGERIDALLRCHRRDLSHTGHLTIRGEIRKGQRRDIVRKLHSQTLEAVEQLPPHHLLFPWPLTRRAIWREVNPIIHAAGLPVDRRNKFHCARRTSATQVAVSLGIAAAAKHMDHSSVQLTIDRYVDPRMIPDNDVADLIQRPV